MNFGRIFLLTLIICWGLEDWLERQNFFQGYSCIGSPNPKQTQKEPHHSPQTPSTEKTNPKNPILDANRKPQTPNHHKWAK